MQALTVISRSPQRRFRNRQHRCNALASVTESTVKRVPCEMYIGIPESGKSPCAPHTRSPRGARGVAPTGVDGLDGP